MIINQTQPVPMILRSRNDFPVPALPVKNMLRPLLTLSNTMVCSLDNLTGFVTVSGRQLGRKPANYELVMKT